VCQEAIFLVDTLSFGILAARADFDFPQHASVLDPAACGLAKGC
jgi:hypothetical protein